MKCGFLCVDGLDFAFPHFPLSKFIAGIPKKIFTCILAFGIGIGIGIGIDGQLPARANQLSRGGKV